MNSIEKYKFVYQGIYLECRVIHWEYGEWLHTGTPVNKCTETKSLLR